jgi:hypothetical protein
MGFFGGGSSSSQSLTDLSQGGDGIQINAGNRSDIVLPQGTFYKAGRDNIFSSVTDQGAVVAGLEIARDALDKIQLANTQSADALAEVLSNQSDMLKQRDEVKAEAAGSSIPAGNFTLKFVAMAGGLSLLAGLLWFFGIKK